MSSLKGKFRSIAGFIRRTPEKSAAPSGTPDTENGPEVEEPAETMELVKSLEIVEPEKPIRTGKPQTYGEVNRQRSRGKRPRRH